jgi:hypothetical protein
MLDVPGDEHVFLWTLMLSVPVWLSWEILANLGGRFVSASRAALLIAIAPLILYAIGANFSIFEQTIADYRLELIANTMLFGAFLLLGVLVRDFEIKLFQDG